MYARTDQTSIPLGWLPFLFVVMSLATPWMISGLWCVCVLYAVCACLTGGESIKCLAEEWTAAEHRIHRIHNIQMHVLCVMCVRPLCLYVCLGFVNAQPVFSLWTLKNLSNYLNAVMLICFPFFLCNVICCFFSDGHFFLFSLSLYLHRWALFLFLWFCWMNSARSDVFCFSLSLSLSMCRGVCDL